jgi:flagellar L-ring protein precursor FlgH
VTIVVAERASAVAKGTTSASRASSAKSSIGALAGPTKAGGRLSDLVSLGSDWKVEGEGQTSRETLVTTTLSARVTQALPNGALAIEGSKEISVNSERQLISIRGIIRPNDLTAGNLVRSDRIAFLEVRINGKGVVGDAVRRPNFLYRLLLGLLPF